MRRGPSSARASAAGRSSCSGANARCYHFAILRPPATCDCCCELSMNATASACSAHISQRLAHPAKHGQHGSTRVVCTPSGSQQSHMCASVLACEAVGKRTWPTCAPSASAASATSTRSLKKDSAPASRHAATSSRACVTRRSGNHSLAGVFGCFISWRRPHGHVNRLEGGCMLIWLETTRQLDQIRRPAPGGGRRRRRRP